VQLREELAELLRRLRITTVHVTHDQQEALAIADRLAIMRAGQIVGVGDGEALYRDPGHPFLAEFLGRVNRLPRDAQAQADAQIHLADARWPCPPALQGCVAVLVRPEDLRLGEPGADAATLRVSRRVFLGERVQLHLAGATVPLIAEVDRDSPARVDDTVGVRVDPARFMPWFDDAGSS
jgi:putative spermidine/putrescine transport system ATP-binding protein